jgi:hypothetical protein
MIFHGAFPTVSHLLLLHHWGIRNRDNRRRLRRNQSSLRVCHQRWLSHGHRCGLPHRRHRLPQRCHRLPHSVGTLLLPSLLHLPSLQRWLLMRNLLHWWMYHIVMSRYRVLKVPLVLLVRLLRHELHLRHRQMNGRMIPSHRPRRWCCWPRSRCGLRNWCPSGQPWNPGGM